MAQYHWTEESAEIERLGAMADAVEVAGCRSLDGVDIERCDSEQADLFSVYFHFTPEWENDPNDLAGAMCVADRNTLEEARAFAANLAARFGLPVNDFAGEAGHPIPLIRSD